MKVILISLFSIISLSSYGHNPLSAKYFYEAGDRGSLLHVYLSQVGLHQALLHHYDAAELDALSDKVYKEIVVKYVKTHTMLSINGKQIPIGEGGIKLGGHQTDLKFILPPQDQDIKEFNVNIPAFSENEHHQTIFSYRIGASSHRVILSHKNDYRADIHRSSSKSQHNIAGMTARSWYIVVVLVVALLGLYTFKSLQRTKTVALLKA